MRARSREVNIFNMSLLDILTGMLGAFLFLMLGLVPYYTKAKKSGNGSDQPAVDMTFNIIARWDSNAKLDVFLQDDSGGWNGANDKSIPLSGRAKITRNACPSGPGWAVVTVNAAAKDHYLFAISPQGPFNPEDLRHIRISCELMEAQIRPDATGFKSFYPDVWVSSFDASGTRPNTLYAVAWVDVTKDTTKGTADDFNLQYDYAYTPVKEGESLPAGAIPLPVGAPMAVTLVPSAPAQVQTQVQTQTPDSGSTQQSVQQPVPNNTPTTDYAPPNNVPAAAPQDAPPKPSIWNFFNWFRSSPAK